MKIALVSLGYFLNYVKKGKYMYKIYRLSIFVFVLVMSGCLPPPIELAPAMLPTQTKLPSSNLPVITEGKTESINLAMSALGKHLGILIAEINVVSVESVTWSDGSLGCPQDGYTYTSALINGYLIVLDANGKSYEYHTNKGLNAILCNEFIPPTEQVKPYTVKDNTMGNPDAPIKIIEYTSYKCGHCSAFAFETRILLEEEYIKTGKVYFISKVIWDELSAEASYCAGEQNKYWELHDQIYVEQASPFSEETMAQWAENVGVEINQFNNCMALDTYKGRVVQDEAESQMIGVTGVPSFFISYTVNGKENVQVFPGHYPIEKFRQVIDEGLAKISE